MAGAHVVCIALTVKYKKNRLAGTENTCLGQKIIGGEFSSMMSHDSVRTATRDMFSSGNNPAVDINPLKLPKNPLWSRWFDGLARHHGRREYRHLYVR
ncbi:hypothetical protein TNCV_3376141 [Trichonephila clavipes]|nr:hypothetical protein TNCV_3376141 [Trichonephila clavipes]